MKAIEKVSLIVLACVFSTTTFAQKKSYMINGNVKDAPDGTIFYLIRSKESGGADTVARVKSKNGNFSIKGSLELVPEIHFLKIDTCIAKITPKAKTWTPILLENKTVSITSSLKEWPLVELEGSEPTIEYNILNELVSAKVNEVSAKVNILKKENPTDNLKIDKLLSEWTLELVAILKSYPNAYATPLLASTMRLDAENSEKVYSAMSAKIKASFYGEKLKRYSINKRHSEQVGEGGVLPTFTILANDGRDIQILEEIAKYKLTLIDFWASWCKPCRNEVPNLLKVYNAFHKKGFNIIGVSSDTKKEAWKKALAEDSTPWTHGLEKAHNRIGKELFMLQSIPAYVLVDQNGKLLAFDRGLSTIKAFGPDIRGEELYGTIEKLLNEIDGKN